MIEIDKYMNEHASILIGLKKVIIYGLDTKQGQRALFEIKDDILSHMQSENDYLYPLLLEMSKNDEDTVFKETLHDFVKDIQETTRVIQDFYNKYTYGSTGTNFLYDFRELFSILSKRINREEKIFYKKLKSFMDKQKV